LVVASGIKSINVVNVSLNVSLNDDHEISNHVIIYTIIMIFINIRIGFMDLVDNISAFYDHHWSSHWNSCLFKNGHRKTRSDHRFPDDEGSKKSQSKEHHLYEIKITNLCQKNCQKRLYQCFCITHTWNKLIKLHLLWILSCLIIFGSFWTMFFFQGVINRRHLTIFPTFYLTRVQNVLLNDDIIDFSVKQE